MSTDSFAWRAASIAARWARIMAAVFLVSSITIAPAQVTFLGSQIQVGGPGLLAPSAIAIDGKGIAYVADRGNNRIVQMLPLGSGYESASTVISGLASPCGVAADLFGNVYIADTGNNRILMLPVTPSGFGTAVTVGIGLNNPMGVAVDTAGNIFVADTGNNRVVEFPYLGGGFGTAFVVGSGFNTPQSVALDSRKNLFIADTGNNQIVEETYSAGVYSVPRSIFHSAGTPTGVSIDSSFDVFIAEQGNNRVVEEPWAAGANRYNTQVVVGNEFLSPADMAITANGDVLVVDSATNKVWQVMGGQASFPNETLDVQSPSQIYNFYINAGTIVSSIGIFAKGVPATEFVDGGDTTCAPGTYTIATICSVSAAFRPGVSGLRMGAIVIYDPNNIALATAYFSGLGLAAQTAYLPAKTVSLGSNLSGPSGVAVDGFGNVYIADTGNNRIVEIPWTGSGYGSQIVLPVKLINSPMGLAVDGAGNLYIVSNGNDKVVILPWTGTGFGPQTKLKAALYAPTSIAFDGAGSIYIADTYDNRVAKLSWTGSAYATEQFLGNYAKAPTGVAVDSTGNVCFTMPYLNSVVRVPWSNNKYLTQVTIPLQGESFPVAVATDANSNLYILDSGNNRLSMMQWNGSTLSPAFTLASGFNAPLGMTTDANGNIYVADTGNNQVVKFEMSSPGTINFATAYVGSSSSDSARTANILNSGNLPFIFDQATFPSDFPEGIAGINPCQSNAQLSQGSGCTVAVNFTPQVVSPKLNESLSISVSSGDSDSATQSFALTGTSLGKLAQSISFPSVPRLTYGISSISLAAYAGSGLPITYTVLSGPATVRPGTNVLTITGVGTVTLQAQQLGNNEYDPSDITVQNVTIYPATLTVTPNTTNSIYGSISTSFGYSLTGFVFGQTAAQAVSGAPVISVSATDQSPVGVYVLTASLGSLKSTNYTFAFAPGQLNVVQKSIQVTAVGASAIYGSPIPAFRWIFTGFVNGDTSAVITGAPAMNCQATPASPVGTYPITASLGTLAAANYKFNFVGSTLQLSPAPLTITAISKTMVYGSAVPPLSFSITGFVDGDTAAGVLHGNPTVSTSATGQSPVGTYAINVSIGTLSATNYRFIFVNGVLTVQKAVLTVTPNNVGMTYGSPVPALSYVITGYVNGDTQAVLGGLPVLSSAANSKSPVGIYTITATVGSLRATNYAFTQATAQLTVSKAVAKLSANSFTIAQGSQLPTLTYNVTGLVNGDTASAITGVPALSTEATSTSAVGTYPVVINHGTAAAENYSLSFINGTLNVTRSAAMITVRPAPSPGVFQRRGLSKPRVQ